MNTLGDDLADFVNRGKLFERGGPEGVHRAKMVCQHHCHIATYVADRKGIEQSPQASLATGCNLIEQVLGRFFCHPLQCDNLLLLETVEIIVTGDQPLRDQLIDKRFSQALDKHCIPTGEITDPFLNLRSAVDVRTTDIDASLILAKRRPAFGTFCGKPIFSGPAFSFVLLDADDMRDDLPGLFHDDRVANANVLALDFFGVVQARPAYRGTGQFDRLQFRHRCDGPGLADLYANFIESRDRFVFFELVGDEPSGALGRATESHTLVEAIDFENQTVHFKIK